MSLGDRRPSRRRPLFVVEHVEVLGAAVTLGIFAVGVVEVRGFRIGAPDQDVLVGIPIDRSPGEDISHHAWWAAENVFPFDPSRVFDHGGVVVKGHRLPFEAS